MVALGGFSSWVAPFWKSGGKLVQGLNRQSAQEARSLLLVSCCSIFTPTLPPSPIVNWGNRHPACQHNGNEFQKPPATSFAEELPSKQTKAQGTGFLQWCPEEGHNPQSGAWRQLKRPTCFSFCFPDLQSLFCAVFLFVLTFKEEVFGVGWGAGLPPVDNTLPYQGRLCLVSCLGVLA